MQYKIRFQDEMKQLAIKVIIKSLFLVMFLFSLTSILTSFFNQEIEARKNLAALKETFVQLYEDNVSFLLDENHVDLYTNPLVNQESFASFQNALNRFNQNRPIQSSVIVVDQNSNVKFASVNENQIPTSFVNYINAINFSVSNQSKDYIRASIYKVYNGYSNLILVKTIYQEDKPIGYVALQIAGNDWSYYALSNFNHDGVITDKYNNIIFYNRPKLITNNYTFAEGKKFRRITLNDETYWMLKEELPQYGFKLFSLVYSPLNSGIVIIAVMLVVIGFLWYKVTKRLADTMANKNAESVHMLVAAMQTIQEQDIESRIEMNTDDEYQYIGDHINVLLDTISNLNQHNTELLQLNNKIEISNLTAQFNPHFLYNTLEIVRNYVFFDKELAEKLIVKLTRILSYSIDNANKDVPLKTDLKYVEDYIEIQKSRFDERFQCNITFEEACMDCIVPKLVLQPIIENSLKYGFRVKRCVAIRIEGHMEAGNLYIKVVDDALGMEETIAKELNERLCSGSNESSSNGLYNIARRLQLKYSPQSGIWIHNETGVGVTVCLRVDQKKIKN